MFFAVPEDDEEEVFLFCCGRSSQISNFICHDPWQSDHHDFYGAESACEVAWDLSRCFSPF